jgi:hypothetical protein
MVFTNNLWFVPKPGRAYIIMMTFISSLFKDKKNNKVG